MDLGLRQPEVAGMMLQSPLTSGIRTKCCDVVAWALCCIDVFKSIDKAPRVEVLTLIMHGMEDVVVPCENGQRLFETFPNTWTPLWVDGAGHNDMEAVAGSTLLRHQRAFIQKCVENRDRRSNEQTVPMSSTAGAGYQGEALPVF